MVNDRRRLPEDPDTLIGAHVMIPAGTRRIYMDEPSLRGKMSEHVRSALGVRIETNGFGIEKAKLDYEEARDRFLEARAALEARKDVYHGLLRKELEKQEVLAERESAENLTARTFQAVRERFAKWKSQLRTSRDPNVRKTRGKALEWCAAVLKDSDILKAECPSAKDLLTVLETEP